LESVAAKKRTRQPITSPDWEEQSPAELIEQGRAAFAGSDYRGAIRAWQRARSVLAARNEQVTHVEAALAEAHFRNGIVSRPANIDDLADAVRLAPDDPRYLYHCALAHQRRGEMEPAISLYRALLAWTPPYTRAAFPLAVALVASLRHPRKDSVWHFLSPAEQARVICAYALIKGHPKTARQYAPTGGADTLWTGLAALRLADPTAEESLRAALNDSALPPAAVAVVHYYLGVLAWLGRQHPAALDHWQAAHSAGMRTAWLSRNLAGAYLHAALTYLETPRIALPQPSDSQLSGDEVPVRAGVVDGTQAVLSEVHRLAECGLKHMPGEPGLIEVANHARSQLGYCATHSGNWAGAAGYLWAASEAGERDRATLTNAALTAEALNRFTRAAELWQCVLRYRPHRPGTTNALSKEQVARVWQRTGECFERAGDYEEAARAYRNAARNNPDAVGLQLSLAEVLIKGERCAAALTTIDQILAIQPNNVAALALQAQAFEKGRYLYAALQTWQRVLDLDPEHATVRQNLARLNRIEGDYQRDNGDLRRAIIAYRDGLKHSPSDARLRASLALARGMQGNADAARREIVALCRERPTDIDVHYWSLYAYLRLAEWDAAEELLDRIQSSEPPPPPDQCIRLAQLCFQRDRSRRAKQLLDLAEKQSHDAQTLMQVAGAFKEAGQDARSVQALKRVLTLQPDHAEAHVLLGLHLLGDGHDPATAEEHFLRAEQLARRTSDSAILLQARLGKNLIRIGGSR
jgi:tetratricopeptide (TPR) repeat protein